jgi:hypothetical protein
VLNKHLDRVILNLGKALAVWHENPLNDTETMGTILNDLNLEAWRMHWEIAPMITETKGGVE